MGSGFKNIMVVTDTTPNSHATEQTALNLAKQHAANVHVVDTVQPPSFTSKLLNTNAEDLFDIVLADKRSRLDKIASVYRDNGLDATSEILIGKSSTEVARAALKRNADLVVRYKRGARSRQSGKFGTTARNLMRICSSPLLFVGHQAVAGHSVLACVNPEHQDAENQAILSIATKLTGPAHQLTGLYCWKLYGEEYLSEYFNEHALHQHFEEAEAMYRDGFDKFVEKHNVEDFNAGFRMENGDPIELIPKICEQEGTEIVVMSSASQNHPFHRLLGSTVESVLDKIDCSLLVVKPIGFKPMVKVPAEQESHAGE